VGKACAPAVTRRKDIGRMTVRPISFQRAQRLPRGKRLLETEINNINESILMDQSFYP
jgi:hypothetical protein